VLCTWVKLLTDLQILGCGLHIIAFGGPGPAGGSYMYSASPDPVAVKRRRVGMEGEGKGWQ